MKKLIVLSIVLLTIFSCNNENGTSKRVESIIKKMSLREKIEFIGGYKDFNIRPMEKYGIPEIHMADGPAGIRNNGLSTAFPASIALAAAWDTAVAQNVGRAIAMEAKSKNIHIVFGPGMNICRAPFNGRNFEYMGEDPFLAGQIASSYIIGMQNQGVVATAKHYAANFMEYNKHKVSSDLDERTLQEIYLPAFKTCVEKGHVGAVMTAYNLVNGEHCSQNSHLNNDILKNDWGFKGMIISDWGSTYNGIAAAKWGIDLEMPSGQFMNVDTLIPAVTRGEISEELINDKVRRILNLYERFHFFETPDISKGFSLNEKEVKQAALNAARAGIVLLKNRNNVLPFDTLRKLKIAIIGPNATPAVIGGGGSSYVQATNPVSLLNAFQNEAGKNSEIRYARGLYDESDLPDDYFVRQRFTTLLNNKKTKGVLAEIFDNTACSGNSIHQQVVDKIDFTFPDSVFKNLPKSNLAIRFTYFVNCASAGDYKFAVAGDDSYRLFVNEKLTLNRWENQPNTIRTSILHFDEATENKVVLEYFQKGTPRCIRSGFNNKIDEAKKSGEILKKGVELAAQSDAVILSVGFNSETEMEGMDRTFQLPEGQDQLIEAISKANKNCILVVNAGGNIAMPWINEIYGLIYAWYPGELGNIAVAEAVFGKLNTSGKLPVSFEKEWNENPTRNSYYDTDNDLHVKFSEGIFLGYRYFDQSNVKPLFPFGFGLSYTDFSYSNLKVSKESIKSGEGLEVSFTLKNTGIYDGAEVSQLYINDEKSSLPRPVKELKGFAKTYLEKGQEAEVRIKLDPSAFSYYTKEKGDWITEPGKFKVLIGNSSQDIRLWQEFAIEELTWK